MSKKIVDTTYVYERLTEADVRSYIESKDVTDNERDGFQHSITKEIDLFKTVRFGKNIVVSKRIAEQFIVDDNAVLKFRTVVYSILLLGSFGLFILALLIPESQHRAVNISDILFSGLSFSLILCMFSLFYGNLKDIRKLIISENNIKNSVSVANDDINIEIRNTTL